MWKWDGSCSTLGSSWGWQLLWGSKDSRCISFFQKNNTDIFHFFIISSHFIGLSPVESCPVQSCLLQAKHPGLDSLLCLGIFTFLWQRAFPKNLYLSVFHLTKNWKQTVKYCIFKRWNNSLCSSWSSVRFIVYFQYHWCYSTVQEGSFTLYIMFPV